MDIADGTLAENFLFDALVGCRLMHLVVLQSRAETCACMFFTK